MQHRIQLRMLVLVETAAMDLMPHQTRPTVWFVTSCSSFFASLEFIMEITQTSGTLVRRVHRYRDPTSLSDRERDRRAMCENEIGERCTYEINLALRSRSPISNITLGSRSVRGLESDIGGQYRRGRKARHE